MVEKGVKVDEELDNFYEVPVDSVCRDLNIGGNKNPMNASLNWNEFIPVALPNTRAAVFDTKLF